jgi:hypothetical protein
LNLPFGSEPWRGAGRLLEPDDLCVKRFAGWHYLNISRP